MYMFICMYECVHKYPSMYICHGHKNWSMKFNLACHASTCGVSLGMPVDAQVSQHDSTAHALGHFLPTGKDR